jgi:hypothetical protein
MIYGWVYFIGAPAANKIKIGFTSGHPSRRLSSLRGGSPVDLRPIGLVRGDRTVEGLLHSFFWDLHYKDEWFHANRLIFEFVRDQARPWVAADEISYPVHMSGEEWIRTCNEVQDPIIDWFDSREIEFRSKSPKNARRVRPVAEPVFATGSEVHMSFEEATRPMGLIRNAFLVIEPQWRLPFLKHLRGEGLATGLLGYLASHEKRCAAAEAVFAENNGRMQHFAREMESAIDGVACEL